MCENSVNEEREKEGQGCRKRDVQEGRGERVQGETD
uniref:Uncharacterized protein n=1 Tax=Anguilla anguilla TaxID=7936 RepID=A0A0E9XDB6_ANGAN